MEKTLILAAVTAESLADQNHPLIGFVKQAAREFAPDVYRVMSALHAGDAAGYLVLDDGLPVAGFVLAFDGNLLDVVAAGGKADFDLVANIMPLIEGLAASSGCEGVKVDTFRRGMVEKLGRMGFESRYVSLVKPIEKLEKLSAAVN